MHAPIHPSFTLYIHSNEYPDIQLSICLSISGLKSESFVWITKFRREKEETNPFKPISVKYYSEKDQDTIQTLDRETEFPKNVNGNDTPFSPG